MPHSPEQKRAYMRDRYYAKREQYIVAQREYRKLIKAMVLEHYGKVCQCCGVSDNAFLSIDHIASDGHEHRKLIGRTGGIGFYTWLKVNNFPPGFQTLCFNCNIARHHNKGVCPHKSHKDEQTNG